MKELKAVMGCVGIFALFLLYGLIGGLEQDAIELGKFCWLGGILMADILACVWICSRKER